MVRVGEDISERLDIVPAQFFVQRQIRGKWACRCCQLMVQERAAPQVFDNALPTPSLQAHTVISRFVDHLPYYRQEQINARAGVHTPRSTLAAWGGQTGAQLMPLYDAHRAFVLESRVVHADETPIALLDPGAGKTKKAYMWAYARGAFEPEPAVVYDFCAGRGGKYPHEFLKGWMGTLVVDAYGGYDATLSLEGRMTANCLAHARRKFDELFKANASAVAAQAIHRIAALYRIEADTRELSCQQRLQMRQERSQRLWQELHVWLQLERTRVPDGSAIAKAIDYSLNHWLALSRFLQDGAVPIDNNHIENQMRPLAIGRRNANCAFMRSRPRRVTSLRSIRAFIAGEFDSHNHRDCRNFKSACGGRYRAGFVSGGSSRARARSFMARSASTYMWVVDGLSCPSHSATSTSVAPD